MRRREEGQVVARVGVTLEAEGSLRRAGSSGEKSRKKKKAGFEKEMQMIPSPRIVNSNTRFKKTHKDWWFLPPIDGKSAGWQHCGNEWWKDIS